MTSERKFIEESVKRVLLKEYLKSKTERSGFGGLDIQRTPMGTRVTLIAERPGMVIGRKGETIKELTEYVETKFHFDNPQIEVKEVSNPNLNPHIMAQKLANALERGWHFRRAGHSTVRRIMSAGAKGCQVIISGKLTGQRHRTEKFREGHIKYCGETKLIWMMEGYAVAKKKLGIIGVKVQIMDPKAKLPDEIELQELKDVAQITTIPIDKTEAVKVETSKVEEGTEAIDTTSETEDMGDAEKATEEKKERKKKVEKITTEDHDHDGNAENEETAEAENSTTTSSSDDNDSDLQPEQGSTTDSEPKQESTTEPEPEKKSTTESEPEEIEVDSENNDTNTVKDEIDTESEQDETENMD